VTSECTGFPNLMAFCGWPCTSGLYVACGYRVVAVLWVPEGAEALRGMWGSGRSMGKGATHNQPWCWIFTLLTGTKCGVQEVGAPGLWGVEWLMAGWSTGSRVPKMILTCGERCVGLTKRWMSPLRAWGEGQAEDNRRKEGIQGSGMRCSKGTGEDVLGGEWPWP
jgi:hypothetical protein